MEISIIVRIETGYFVIIEYGNRVFDMLLCDRHKCNDIYYIIEVQNIKTTVNTSDKRDSTIYEMRRRLTTNTGQTFTRTEQTTNTTSVRDDINHTERLAWASFHIMKIL